MIYKRLIHITMTEDRIDDIKTDGVVKAYRANIYNREGGEFKVEFNDMVVAGYSTMEFAIEETIDRAISPDIVVSGIGKYVGLEVRCLSRAVFIALAKKLEVQE